MARLVWEHGPHDIVLPETQWFADPATATGVRKTEWSNSPSS